MLKFSKMHGTANDFVVIDAINQTVELTVEQIRFLADRHIGIGCDQLLLVERSSLPEVDFKYRIFNADGSEVEQCGNGVRCFARYVYEKKLTDKRTIAVETLSGVVYPTIDDINHVTVDMGVPGFEPESIPFIADKQHVSYPLLLDNEMLTVSVVSMGNPHAVTIADNLATTNLEHLGPLIEGHARFPERVNAGFMQIINVAEINLRVYERGVGETQSCGTGACAAVVAGRRLGLLQQDVIVHLSGGDLKINWQGEGKSVLMTGGATHVFDGEIEWALINKHSLQNK